jgi:uncharacterized hydrophobic protein (TIGR00271 family)
MARNPLQAILNAVKYRLNLDDEKAADEEVVIDEIRLGVEFKGSNLWTLTFAIFIASIGLDVNSTAVIIGAMLISPLMGPIMGIGLGAGIFDYDLIKNAAKNFVLASAIGLFASTIYFVLSPLDQARSELLSRTTPTLWDVLIALFGGLAGIVASSRKKYNNVIPGVAIATALMPPLCTAGFGLATQQWHFLVGALYLYIINSVLISISTYLVVRYLKYRTLADTRAKAAKNVKRWIGAIAILTVLPSIFLAYFYGRNEIFKRNAERFINMEIIARDNILIHRKIDPQTKKILVSLLDLQNPDSLKKILDAKKSAYRIDNADIVLKSIHTANYKDVDQHQFKEKIIEEVLMRQQELMSRNAVVQNTLKNHTRNNRNLNHNKRKRP